MEDRRIELTAPRALDAGHSLDSFTCSEPSLEHWLKRRAMPNQVSGASRCFVVCAASEVVGYYAIAAGSVSHVHSPGKIKRNMPDPIPVIVLGRLAVHKGWEGKGIGAGLLQDALLRSQRLSQEIGVRALLCHAISDSAKAFYLRYGFVTSPIEPMTVMLPLDLHR